MIKASTEIRSLIANNHFLSWGMSHRIFNLSRLTQYIKPLIEARTKKHLKESSILMNLSRMQRTCAKRKVNAARYDIESLNVYSNLSVLTFHRTASIHEKITRDYAKIKESNRFMSITEGVHEITVIIEQKLRALFLKDAKPKKEVVHVAAVSISFSEKQSEAPGFLHLLLQLLTLQGINIVEVSSTFTEIVFYVHTKDAKFAFDTFYNTLMHKN